MSAPSVAVPVTELDIRVPTIVYRPEPVAAPEAVQDEEASA